MDWVAHLSVGKAIRTIDRAFIHRWSTEGPTGGAGDILLLAVGAIQSVLEMGILDPGQGGISAWEILGQRVIGVVCAFGAFQSWTLVGSYHLEVILEMCLTSETWFEIGVRVLTDTLPPKESMINGSLEILIVGEWVRARIGLVDRIILIGHMLNI